jgi:hypothetical protein
VSQTRKTGDLPHLSYILRKPEPLGTEFKNIACTITGVFLHLEIQRGKLPMRALRYTALHGVTAATTMRMIEATNKCGQDGSVRNASEDIAFGDSWFVSVEAVTHAWLEPGIGVRLGGIVKTSHSRYPKDYLETTMKDWPSGSHLLFAPKPKRDVRPSRHVSIASFVRLVFARTRRGRQRTQTA